MATDQEIIDIIEAQTRVIFPSALAVKKLILYFFKETGELASAVAAAKVRANVLAYLGSGIANRTRIDRLVNVNVEISVLLANIKSIPKDPDQPDNVDALDFLLFEELVKSGRTCAAALALIGSFNVSDEAKEVALMFLKAGETPAAAQAAALIICPE